ncbi:hypothetical protein [Myxococcus faecalis]|uniref:hypothetical protein n=1 Tax=Myxococcus faecalis TaxID=3115646 RepID=UPI003CF96C34
MAFFALHYPDRAALPSYLLTDAGASLKGDWLVESGLRPGVDFGYTYGPLSLVLGRATYGVLGRTATAHLFIVAVLSLFAFVGLARCLIRLEGGWTALVLALVLTQPLVSSFGFNLTYGAEAALLLHALAFHLEGRRRWALVLAVLAALVKPSMGLLYTALLVLWILKHAKGAREAWRQLWPGLLAGLSGLLVCVAVLGGMGTFRTALPLVGVVHYSARASSWTRLIESLVAPPGVNFRYYLGTLAGFWLAASVLLILGVLRPRVIRGGVQGDTRFEVALTCAALHVAFATLFFGPWLNYLGLLLVGVLCAVEVRSARGALVMLVLVGSKALAVGAVGAWRERAPMPDRMGTWARPEEVRELEEVVRVADGRPVLFVTTGYPEGLVPGALATRSWFLVPGVLFPSEQEAIARQVRAAPVVVVPAAPMLDGLSREPWLEPSLAGHRAAFRGRMVDVLVMEGGTPSP